MQRLDKLISEIDKSIDLLFDSVSPQAFILSEKEQKLRQLAEYIELLERWTAKVDLVSQQSGLDMVIPHIVDSVAALLLINPTESLVYDVGSGAGLPGIVWAVLRPETRFVLIEPRKKRIDFLSEVRRVLRLKNVELLSSRMQELSPCSDSESKLYACRALGVELDYLEFAQAHRGLAAARAIILAGPSWECPGALPKPNSILDYELYSSGPKRKIPIWEL